MKNKTDSNYVMTKGVKTFLALLTDQASRGTWKNAFMEAEFTAIASKKNSKVRADKPD